MGILEKTKESIGYLKVLLSIFVAIDISLIAWLFKNHIILSRIPLIGAGFLILIISFVIIVVNRKILFEIDSLEDL